MLLALALLLSGLLLLSLLLLLHLGLLLSLLLQLLLTACVLILLLRTLQTLALLLSGLLLLSLLLLLHLDLLLSLLLQLLLTACVLILLLRTLQTLALLLSGLLLLSLLLLLHLDLLLSLLLQLLLTACVLILLLRTLLTLALLLSGLLLLSLLLLLHLDLLLSLLIQLLLTACVLILLLRTLLTLAILLSGLLLLGLLALPLLPTALLQALPLEGWTRCAGRAGSHGCGRIVRGPGYAARGRLLGGRRTDASRIRIGGCTIGALRRGGRDPDRRHSLGDLRLNPPHCSHGQGPTTVLLDRLLASFECRHRRGRRSARDDGACLQRNGRPRCAHSSTPEDGLSGRHGSGRKGQHTGVAGVVRDGMRRHGLGRGKCLRRCRRHGTAYAAIHVRDVATTAGPVVDDGGVVDVVHHRPVHDRV